MPPGEITITCPNCQHHTSLPVAAVRRNNYHCTKCYEKVPLGGVRTHSGDAEAARPARPKKSSLKRR